MRARLVPLVALLAALAGNLPATAAAPDVVLSAGRTAAVSGEPSGGGASFALSLLWALEEHYRLGVTAFADDLGEQEGRLLGPGDVDLGPIAVLHRDAMGVAWRTEGHLPSKGNYDAFATATWGFYRVTDDLRGTIQRGLNAAGLGVGIGLARRVAGSQALGLLVRYHTLSRREAPRYLSVAVEWRRHRNAAP